VDPGAYFTIPPLGIPISLCFLTNYASGPHSEYTTPVPGERRDSRISDKQCCGEKEEEVDAVEQNVTENYKTQQKSM